MLIQFVKIINIKSASTPICEKLNEKSLYKQHFLLVCFKRFGFSKIICQVI